jgi:fluoride exporter
MNRASTWTLPAPKKANIALFTAYGCGRAIATRGSCFRQAESAWLSAAGQGVGGGGIEPLPPGLRSPIMKKAPRSEPTSEPRISARGVLGEDFMIKLLLIAVFGGVGSLLRYLVTGWCQKLANGSFPLGTLCVNVVGCLLIGLLGALFFGPYLIREEYRLALMVGLLGGFTTFSSFAFETLTLASGGELGLALGNIVLSNVLGLLAAWAGYRFGVKLFGV